MQQSAPSFGRHSVPVQLLAARIDLKWIDAVTSLAIAWFASKKRARPEAGTTAAATTKDGGLRRLRFQGDPTDLVYRPPNLESVFNSDPIIRSELRRQSLVSFPSKATVKNPVALTCFPFVL